MVVRLASQQEVSRNGKEFLVVRVSLEGQLLARHLSLNGLKGRLGSPGDLCHGSCCQAALGNLSYGAPPTSLPAIGPVSHSTSVSWECFTINLWRVTAVRGTVQALSSRWLYNLVDLFLPKSKKQLLNGLHNQFQRD